MFLVGRKPEALLDAGDLRVAEQRVGFLRGRSGGKPGLVSAGDIAAGTPIFGASMSAGAADAKASRSGSFRRAACGGSNDASATPATANLSCLLSLFATGLLTTGKAISARAAGTLSRPRMLVAAAPTTRRQISAMRVMTFVKPFSVSVGQPRLLSRKLGTN